MTALLPDPPNRRRSGPDMATLSIDGVVPCRRGDEVHVSTAALQEIIDRPDRN
ncbi:hypothetical protein Q0Z83_018380 [Actinoplanes sichuanensis]|nr:hypothetical protein Q0Z83_018380 [Actinoplanes sichuanensis]